jgi:hypothetical protein
MLMDNVCQPPETHHLWIWINEPQHSAALQALLGIVTTIASLAAAFAALKAYLKTVDQVRIANQQLEVARRQANAAQRPFLVIEEEVVDASPHIKGKVLIVHNNGSGPVTDSYWIRDADLKAALQERRPPGWTRVGSISLNGRAALRLPDSEKFASNIGSGIRIHYKDLEGATYFCLCTTSRLGPNCDNGELSPDESSPTRKAH